MGQSESSYYRYLVKSGGYIWLQSKAIMVLEENSCQPKFIVLINHVLRL